MAPRSDDRASAMRPSSTAARASATLLRSATSANRTRKRRRLHLDDRGWHVWASPDPLRRAFRQGHVDSPSPFPSPRENRAAAEGRCRATSTVRDGGSLRRDRKPDDPTCACPLPQPQPPPHVARPSFLRGVPPTCTPTAGACPRPAHRSQPGGPPRLSRRRAPLLSPRDPGRPN